MRRELGHPPPAARWAEAPAFAGECDQHFAKTVAAAEAREPARHHAAGEKFPQLAFDERRDTITAAAPARFGEKGLEVLADDAAEQALFRMAANVGLASSSEPSVTTTWPPTVWMRGGRISRRIGGSRGECSSSAVR